MKPNLFLIPGFRQDCLTCGYQPIIKALTEKFNFISCDISWHRTDLNDWSTEFSKVYLKNKSDKNIILGFSFGAMIATNISFLKPNHLILCSMSPYFSEYLKRLPQKWIKSESYQRLKIFKKTSIKKNSDLIKINKTKTSLFVGGQELKHWPSIKIAFEENIKLLNPKDKFIIPNAKHKIETDYLHKLIDFLKTL